MRTRHPRGAWITVADEQHPAPLSNAQRGNVVRIDNGPAHIIVTRRGRKAIVAPLNVETEVIERELFAGTLYMSEVADLTDSRAVSLSSITHVMAGGQR